MNKPIVYFSSHIDPETVVKLYEALKVNLPGKVACKVHSGEEGNQNYVRPEFLAPIVKTVNGTIVETNTAYPGARNESKKHKKLLEKHGWSKWFNVDLLDEEGPDMDIALPHGKVIQKHIVGKNIANYDSLLGLSHFKGHPMGGYGGALKQLSIGCASSRGKAHIHSAGKTDDQNIVWNNLPAHDRFLEAMAESAKGMHDYFMNKGGVAYINIMVNMSVDCDGCEEAEDPCLKDIGILASLDPVAIDAACLDLVKQSNDPGLPHFLERVNSRHGEDTIEVAENLGLGSTEYELVHID